MGLYIDTFSPFLSVLISAEFIFFHLMVIIVIA